VQTMEKGGGSCCGRQYPVDVSARRQSPYGPEKTKTAGDAVFIFCEFVVKPDGLDAVTQERQVGAQKGSRGENSSAFRVAVQRSRLRLSPGACVELS
jgi:hypothetical protein